MLNNWKKDKLGNLCYRIGDGLHGTPSYVDDSDIFFINGNNLKDGKILITDDTKKVSEETLVDNQKDLNKNTLLLSINGTIGNLAFYNGEKIMLGKSASYLNFKTEINNFYYYYLQLKGVQDYLYNIATGSTIKNLGLKSINELEVPVPKENEWKGIAKVLSDLDAKIEVNNKINQELEAMAKTLYDYWFVQFDFPNEDGKPYKSSGGKMVYNEELKREIPEGWEVKELGKFAEIKRGKLITEKTANLDGGIKVVSAGVDFSYMHDEFNREIYTITVSGSGANAGLVNFWREPIFANDCSTVRGKSDNETFVILQFLKLRQEYIFNQARGSAQPHVYPKDLAILKILIPDFNLFEIYGKKVYALNEKIAVNLKESQKLSELRDWLSPMLMNGQVMVNNQKSKEKTAYKNNEPLSIVADETTHYDSFKDIFESINYDYEVATIAWLTERELKRSYGKKYIQKTYSNMQLLNILPAIKQQPVFQEHYWGMYSKAIEQTINNEKFIKFENVAYGKKVVKLHFKHLLTVSKWTREEGYNTEFTNQLKKVLNIYEHPLIDKSMDRIELFNTILECITILKTYDYAPIYTKMKKWEMREGNYKTKADKFKPEETRLMIGLIRELKRN